MADSAQDELDRMLGTNRTSSQPHPEDRHNHSDSEPDEDVSSRAVPKSKSKIRSRPANDDSQEEDERDSYDDDTSFARFTKPSNSISTYTLPGTAYHGNTGPKGVISDAQSFDRARKARGKASYVTGHGSLQAVTSQIQRTQDKDGSRRRENKDDELSDLDSEDDVDDAFMATWRANRLAELQSSKSTQQTLRNTTGTGTLSTVSAAQYLAYIESPSPTVVFIFDPLSPQSLRAEDKLGMLAYRYSAARFVKLHHEIADLREIDVPAVLVYRDGEVVVMIGDVEGGEVEELLKGRGILR